MIHVSWARTDRFKCPVLACPTCKRRRKMLCQFQEWYGWRQTCLTCGEKWEDGERLPRPFSPRWRVENVKEAKWRLAVLRKRGG